MSTQKRKIDVATKLLLAQEAKASSINAVAKKYDVARENVRRWIRSEDQLAQLAQAAHRHGDAPAYRLHGGGRKISYEPMDQELADKVFAHRANDIRVTRRMIAEWAQEMKERLQVDVVVCPTWVSRFMARHGISLRKDGAVAPTESVKPDQQKGRRAVVSAEDKLAIMYFFENSNRDMQQTLLQFYGHIDDPKAKQVKARNIYNWLHKRDDIALRAHKERAKKEQQQKNRSKSAGRGVPPRLSIESAASNGDCNGGEDAVNDIVGDGDGNVDDDDDEDESAHVDGRTYGFGGDEDGEDGEEEEEEEEEQEEEESQENGKEREEGRDHALEPASATPPVPLPRPQTPKIVVPPRFSIPQTPNSGRVDSANRRKSTRRHPTATGSEQAEDQELKKQKREIKQRQAELKERKEQLLVESIRCNNVLKRIKIAEENMLARKRLKDAGVSQEEIDDLLPVVRVNGDV